MRLRWGLVSFALLSCPFPSHAQAIPAEGQAPAATFKAETRAVDVDIVVLDSHGEPVKGLHREDFAITENGASQTATFFEEHPAETAQANAAANVLLIDTLNTPKEDLGFVRRQVADYLKKMAEGSALASETHRGEDAQRQQHAGVSPRLLCNGDGIRHEAGYGHEYGEDQHTGPTPQPVKGPAGTSITPSPEGVS